MNTRQQAVSVFIGSLISLICLLSVMIATPSTLVLFFMQVSAALMIVTMVVVIFYDIIERVRDEKDDH